MSKKDKKTKGSAEPVDAYVGEKIRVRRSLLGMSQEKLAENTGVTFQQIQKYERGKNRVSSSRLFDISKILEVPISYFFPDQDTQNMRSAYGLSDNDQEGFEHNNEEEHDLLQRKETLKLLRYYYKMSPAKRKSFFELIKTCSTEDEE